MPSDSQTVERAGEAIVDLLRARDPGKTICPSEAARVLARDGDFRAYMEPVREAAARLAEAGRVEITQKGSPVRIGEVKGPIRIGSTEGEGGR